MKKCYVTLQARGCSQETFFPRDKIQARINTIKNMKEDPSLDDLFLTRDQVKEGNIVSDIALDLFLQQYPGAQTFSFAKALYLYVLEKTLQSGGIGLDEGKMVLAGWWSEGTGGGRIGNRRRKLRPTGGQGCG